MVVNCVCDSLCFERKQKIVKQVYGLVDIKAFQLPSIAINSRFQKQITEDDVVCKKPLVKYGKDRLQKPRIKHRMIYNGFDIVNKRSWRGYEAYMEVNGNRLSVNKAEDPRSFFWRDNVWIVFNGCVKGNGVHCDRKMFLHNCNTNHTVQLKINGQSETEKNWSPLIWKDELYLVYSIDPFTLLKPDVKNGCCKLVCGKMENQGGRHKICNGTPYLPWMYDTYVGFCHTRLPYYAVPTKINIEKKTVKFYDRIIFDKPGGAKWHYGKKGPIQFPFHLTVENTDVELSIDFSDHYPTILIIDFYAFCQQFSEGKGKMGFKFL